MQNPSQSGDDLAVSEVDSELQDHCGFSREQCESLEIESDRLPEDRIELVSVVGNSVFLDGSVNHCNENLNVLVGGRGTGKSTIVESIRYALGLYLLRKKAAKTHDSIIHQVLQSGTKISLQVRSPYPNEWVNIVERNVPNTLVDKD